MKENHFSANMTAAATATAAPAKEAATAAVAMGGRPTPGKSG